MSKIKVYRIEHSQTKLGPFTHNNQIPEVLNKGLNNSLDIMEDIDDLSEVQAILKMYPNAVFAFSSKEKCERFIKNKKILNKHGFVMTEYEVDPLYISKDEQVIFCF
jgi:hypothetical protein